MKIYIVKAFEHLYDGEPENTIDTTYLQLGAYTKLGSAAKEVKEFAEDPLTIHGRRDELMYTPDEIAIAAKICINQHVRCIQTDRYDIEVMIEELEVDEN